MLNLLRLRIPALFVLLSLLSPAIPLADLSLTPEVLAKCLEYLGPAARWEIRDPGPWIWLSRPRAGTRAIETITELKIAQYNLENLSNNRVTKVFSRRQNRMIDVPPSGAKPLADQVKLAQVITAADPDVIVAEEVKDAYAAQDFIVQHLGDRYRVLEIDGNDQERNVALFVKKDLPFDIEVQSHRQVKNAAGTDKEFARDFPVASFYAPHASKTDLSLFDIGLGHFKSQRDSPNDPRSVIRRTNEVKAAARIVDFFQKMHPETPMFLFGDFNADIRTAPEFQSLWDNGFHDALGLGANPIPPAQRITQTYHPFNGPTIQSQLDGTLVNEVARKDGIVKNAAIIPYLLPDGTPRPYARTFQEREQQGSDHWMVQVTFDFQKMLQLWESRRINQTATSSPLLH